MFEGISPLMALRERLDTGESDALGVAREFGGRANGNALGNTYVRLLEPVGEPVRGALYGVPISIKDCFDVAGTVTTCGARFYAETNPVSERDSAVAERLREVGCWIPGKTHLHPLAYGITGQNAFYGDCLQPRDAALLTGGSSSGAAASVQEGSAIAAIGTDTGGSVRVPAALCGLVGFRASQGFPERAWPGMWRGGHPLAPSFDTLGLLFQDTRDAADLVGGVFGIEVAAPRGLRMGCVSESWMGDCELSVLAAYRAWKEFLVLAGATLVEFVPPWDDSMEIFAGIQAHEAAGIHRGHYAEFEGPIAQRLAWGESLAPEQVAALRERRRWFCAGMDGLLEEFDFLMMPCAPVSRLRVEADQTAVRAALLRYTTPVSLAGLPVIALPGEEFGTGVQVIGRSGAEGELLGFLGAVGLG
ncbi:amidase/aspartyl-tRNA(Asn)/glutamyl-tRNA(Gln) amidotransferase subunit A [Granulicella pectinivorans]|uniref:Amidase/aspartyl-tRNA(Asn)/glutamyl-tRNA(Gln) amidotransferase subunit A n=1 Tax=Granulicella pectinivorans TaxID=474950 RepID=A0A1I6L8N7_9BACT|nr:amidase [Granulicella pectinivorans]SFR99772.1 amidase/aspartyl-tRNA(Asn)/glutamyl-tRNA(Gln) amidotransferase subunit A [Granulicella pectinivorans]